MPLILLNRRKFLAGPAILGSFIAVGNSGLFKVSEDLINWTTHDLGLANTNITSVASGSGVVAVATSDGRIVYKSGDNWISRTLSAGTSLRIRYVNGYFFALAPTSTVWRANPSSLSSWTTVATYSSPLGPRGVYAVGYGHGRYVICSFGESFSSTSSNAGTWSSQSHNRSQYEAIDGTSFLLLAAQYGEVYRYNANGFYNKATDTGIQYHNSGGFKAGGLVAFCGSTGSAARLFYTTNDGASWTVPTINQTAVQLANAIAFDGTYYTIGTDGKVTKSTNLSSWTTHSQIGALNHIIKS